MSTRPIRLSPRQAERLFAVGAVSQYIGAAVAWSVFADLGARTVVWIRVLSAALVLVSIARPTRADFGGDRLRRNALFGGFLGGMNVCFYLSLELLPLGNAVAIEFMGPIAVAAFAARGRRGAVIVLLAAVGGLLVAAPSSEGSAEGVIWALAAGAMWAGYIVAGKRVAASGDGVTGLGVSMLLAAVLLTPMGVWSLSAQPQVAIGAIGLAILAGVLSNVIPYSVDQVVLKLVSRARFALLQALLPVVALAIGLVVLGQVPSAQETVGVMCVGAALAIRAERADDGARDLRI